MDILEDFLMNSTVVKIDSCAELVQFCYLMRQMGLKKIQSFWKAIKGGTDVGWIPNNYPWEELCVEYQMGKGFTISGKADNLAYRNNVVSFYEFKESLKFNFVEKDFVAIFDEVNKLPDKGFSIRIVKKAVGSNNSEEGYVYKVSNATLYGHSVWTTPNVDIAKVYTTKNSLLKALDIMSKCGEFDNYDYEYLLEETV